MDIRAIIWDVGGVLERTEDLAPRRALAERLGLDMGTLEHFIFGHNDGHRLQKGLISLDEHWQNVQIQLDVSRSELEQIVAEFFSGDRLDYNLVEYIRVLKKKYTTAILSNYFPTLRQKVQHTWQIADAFDHLIVSSEVGFMKPDPVIYQIVLDAVACDPVEVVFIDDFIENVTAAQQAGMHAIHFKNPEQAKRDLENLLAQ